MKEILNRLTITLCLPLLLVASAMFSCMERPRTTTACHGAVEVAKQHYDKARALQHEAKYGQAIASFRQCVETQPTSTRGCDSLLTVVTNAMVQLVNCFQSMDRPDEGACFFDSLRRSPTPFIRTNAMRDLYSISAYAKSRTDKMGEAEKLADSALAMPLRKATHERLFRDYAYAAAIFFSNPSRQNDVIELSQKALDEANQCNNTSGAQYVTSMLGTLYRRTGRLSEAIDLYRESLETARDKGDSIGQAVACNGMAELYLYFKLPRYADAYASMAVALHEAMTNGNAAIYTQSLLLKGQAQECNGRADSAELFYAKAENTCRSLPYTSGMADVDYLTNRHAILHATGETYEQALRKLSKVAHDGTTLLRAKAYYAMAEGCLNHGNTGVAEQALDSMYAIVHLFTPMQHIDIDYKRIIELCAQKGDIVRLKRYATDLATKNSAEAEAGMRARVYETIVSLKTEAEHQKIRAEHEQMSSQKTRYEACLVVLLMSLVALSMWIVYHRRIINARRMLMEKRISSLLDKLEKAKRDKISMEQHLSAITMRNQGTIEKEKVEIPIMLKDNSLDEFRLRFEQLYPNFVPLLRKRAVGITRIEEVHCMLIALGQDLHQTAALMGIAYRSVNMARYRIRKKMCLNSETTLEKVVMEMFENVEEQKTGSTSDKKKK